MLEFSRNPEYQSPKWPEGYWVKEKAPADAKAFDKCIKQIKKDRNEFVALLENEDADLYSTFEHGKGQTLLHEALQIADHNSYHIAEIIVIRRLLGDWK
jgi:succinate dehydrogenase flavin-adding protein (antitoxin of CptAB toxin-antitoxin module)